MDKLDRLAWEILNATADDWENLEQIYRQLCFEILETSDRKDKVEYHFRPLNGAPLLSEIAERVRGLVEVGLLAPEMDENGCAVRGLDDLSYVWRAWFHMTAQGRAAWAAAEPALEV